MNIRSIFKTGFPLFVMAVISCSGDQGEPTDVIRPVRYQQVLLAGSEQTRTFSGTSKAGTEANLSFKVNGTLNSLNVKVGDPVRKNTLLATIENSDAQLTYEKSVVALEKTRIQRETAKSSLDRVRGLYENNNVSLQDYEAAKSSYATANAAYDADKRNVDLQKRQLEYYNLYAPIEGIVTSINVKENENIRSGQLVVIINAGDNIEIVVGVPESFIAKTKKGDVVKVRFSSIPGQVFDGIISEVAFNISANTSTYPLTVSLTAPTSDIRPGMSADVTFNFVNENTTASQMIVAPVSAVGKDTQGNFVFVLNKESDSTYVVEKRMINVGNLLPDGFEILSGISEREFIATAGLSSLMDGMKVRLLEE